MPLPGVKITLGNGALGRVAATNDGVAGLVLTGTAVAGKLQLNKPYQISSTRDLVTLGITVENNPLAEKEIKAFYAQAGDGAELYLLIVSQATTLTAICDPAADSPLCKLIDYAAGRIRLVGINKLPPDEYEADTTQGIDADVITAAAAAQNTIVAYQEKIAPFRLLLPACGWSGTTENLFKPREASYNGVAIVMAADVKIGAIPSAAIGQVLGRASAIPVNYSIARVKSGTIAAVGYMTDGRTPQECAGLHKSLHDAGYIFYRTFTAKNGYYLNDDGMAAALSDDYSSLNLGRVIDKAIIIAYTTYISEIQDSIEVDDSGQLPQALCTYFESNIQNAVAAGMQNEISSFTVHIDPKQNILSASTMDISCVIVPKGVLKTINVTLGFSNPALKQ